MGIGTISWGKSVRSGTSSEWLRPLFAVEQKDFESLTIFYRDKVYRKSNIWVTALRIGIFQRRSLRRIEGDQSGCTAGYWHRPPCIVVVGICQRIHAWRLHPCRACYRANFCDCLGSHQFSRTQDVEALGKSLGRLLVQDDGSLGDLR